MKFAVLGNGKIKVYVYAKDHRPPHAHVIAPGKAAAIEINTSKILGTSGFSKRDLRTLQKWVASNKQELMAKWSELHDEES